MKQVKFIDIYYSSVRDLYQFFDLYITCTGVFPGWRPVTGLDENLLPAGLDHVNIFADLLERHLEQQPHSVS